MKPLRMKLTH
jgi:acetoin utilization deacetylase AcuC-like enzyme